MQEKVSLPKSTQLTSTTDNGRILSDKKTSEIHPEVTLSDRKSDNEESKHPDNTNDNVPKIPFPYNRPIPFINPRLNWGQELAGKTVNIKDANTSFLKPDKFDVTNKSIVSEKHGSPVINLKFNEESEIQVCNEYG